MTREEEFQPVSMEMTSPPMSDEDRDLGFGSKVTTESRLRFLNRDGTFNVQRTGFPLISTLNLYHFLLTMSWTWFLGLVLILYFFSNIIFAGFYSTLGAESLVDTSEVPTTSLFIRGFFFSVQTFATIGYGTIHPVGIIANLLVTIESYYSLLVNALITGLVFARFSRPTAKIVFSETAVIAPYRGITGFMFRLVNSRNSQIIEVNAEVLLARFVEKEGEKTRRFDTLKLEREKVAFLPLTWTVVHPIDEDSPMKDLTSEDLINSDAEFLIMLNAMDETFAQIVHTRSSYKAQDIKTGYKFSNIYNQNNPGDPISIDIRKLSQVEKVS